MNNRISKLIPHPVKGLIKKVLRKRKFKDFKKTAYVLSQSELIKSLGNAGIKKGDLLFIHSSLRGLGFIENGPKTLIEALKTVVGHEGTLVFPTFTMESSMYDSLKDNDHVFNISSSKSTVGAITNEFLKSSETIRSIHPTHSVAAWGKHAEHICKDHYLAETNFGLNTPFERFLSLNGKLVGIGINYAPVTFYHVFEDLNLDLFPTVYLDKTYSAEMINEHDEVLIKDVLCHNPEFHKTRIEKDPEVEAFFRGYFEQNNISKTSEIGQGKVWWMHTKDLIDELEKLNSEGINIYNISKTK